MCLSFLHKWETISNTIVELFNDTIWTTERPIGYETHLLLKCTKCGTYKSQKLNGYFKGA